MVQIGGQNQYIWTVYYLCFILNSLSELVLVIRLGTILGDRDNIVKEARWRAVTCGDATADIVASPHEDTKKFGHYTSCCGLGNGSKTVE